MAASLSKRQQNYARAFVAIELPRTIRATLAGLEGELASPDWTLRWVAPERIHLTVRFLGLLSRDSVVQAAETVRAVALATRTFELSLASVGAFFAGSGEPRVVWVGLQRDDGYAALQSLFAALETGLVRHGFEPEPRRFSPHLTIARVREGMLEKSSNRLRAAIDALAMRGDVVGSFEVRALTLMRSDLAQDGPTYTPIQRTRLVADDDI